MPQEMRRRHHDHRGSVGARWSARSSMPHARQHARCTASGCNVFQRAAL
jgi:hypothetical protein